MYKINFSAILFMLFAIISFSQPMVEAEGNIEGDDIQTNTRKVKFGLNQYLYGDDASALFWNSNHTSHSQIILRDKENTLYGKLLGNGDGLYFGLIDGDGDWSYLAAKDSYTDFRINNDPKMRILDTGHIGIGTTSPSGKLTVKSAVSEAGLESLNPNGNTHLPWSNGWSYLSGKGIIFRTNDNTEKMRIASNGNVGIGITDPQKKLVVRGATEIGGSTESNSLKIQNFTSALAGIPGSTFGLQVIGPLHSHLVFDIPANDGNDGFYIRAPSTLGTNPTIDKTVFAVKGTGKTVIGNVSFSSNNYKLFVETGIMTEKVRVAVKNTTEWADYVFDDDYKIMPIAELEDYISENKHLPNVPSAEDMVDRGLDVASMDSKLLEKIEEAYLYIIQLEKRIKELEKK